MAPFDRVVLDSLVSHLGSTLCKVGKGNVQGLDYTHPYSVRFAFFQFRPVFILFPPPAI